MIVILEIQKRLRRLVDHIGPVPFKHIEQSDASYKNHSKIN